MGRNKEKDGGDMKEECIKADVENGDCKKKSKTKKKPRNAGIHKWLVLLSTFVVMSISLGYMNTQGPLFVIIMRRYNSTRAQTAIIQSLTSSFFMGMGFFYGILIHKIGPRVACMIASLVSVAALIASAFANSITHLVISLGVVLGQSVSPLYIGSITATGHHFEGTDCCAMVMSLLTCGSALGGALYPYIMQYLNMWYGLSGVFLILAGLQLNNFAATLMWSLPTTHAQNVSTKKVVPKAKHKATQTQDKKYRKLKIEENGEHKVAPPKPKRKHLIQNGGDNTTNTALEDECKTMVIDGNLVNGNQMHRISKSLHIDTQNSLNGTVENTDDIADNDSIVESDLSASGRIIVEMRRQSHDPACDTYTMCSEYDPFNNQDNVKTTTASQMTILESLKTLLRKKEFLTYAVGMALTLPAMHFIPLFIVDVFFDKGFTESNASLGIMLYNIVSVAGRFFPFVLSKVPRFTMPTLAVPIVASITEAIAIIGIIFIDSLEGCLFLMCLLGLGMGVFSPAISLTTFKIVGVEHLSNAIGILLTMSGVVNAIGGPLSGYARDKTNSYFIPLLSFAAACALGFCLFLLSHICRRTSKANSGTHHSDREQLKQES